jgi:hypothetical protein
LQWIESEKMRLAHLRDRASDMGHRKEYPFRHSLINQYLVGSSWFKIMVKLLLFLVMF